MTLPDLSRYDRFALDTETTGKTSRDVPVGLVVSTPDGGNTYARWGHRDGGNNCSLADVILWARRELTRDNQVKIFHSAAFDLRMMAYVGIPCEHRVEDTQFLAAILNELEPSFALDDLAKKHAGVGKEQDYLYEALAKRYGGAATRRSQAGNIWKASGDLVEPYAHGDGVATLALYDVLRPRVDDEGLAGVYQMETALIPLLLKMHLTGVRVHRERAEALVDDLTDRLVRAHERWEQLAPGVNYNSTPQLAPLFEANGLPVWKTPVRVNAKGEETGGQPSITKDLREQLDHPIPNTINEIKRLEKFRDTFVKNYVLKNVHDDGLVHGEFHPLKTEQYGTVSGRFSSAGELNLQNMPARDEEVAPLIRGLFIPYLEGQRWLKIDYSQIEFRFLAHYGGGQIAAAYNEDPLVDFHDACAKLVGIPRKPAKNINFGLVYGMGVKLMAVKLGLSVEDARELLETYHGRLPEVRRLYQRADRRAASRGVITTWGGRKRRFVSNNRGRYQSTHKALNALLQGSAADLIKLAMARVGEIVDWQNVHLHLTVHDELDFSIPKGEAGDRFVKQAKELMEDFELRVPVVADAETGPDWGHCEAWKEAA